jgi:hypothetical protein
MEDRIKDRIAELTKAERQAEMQLIIVRNRLAELEALLRPEPTGDNLGEQTA